MHLYLHRTNHSIFNNWTEESAYILGFWYADGNLELKKARDRYYKLFAISNTDHQIMLDMAAILGCLKLRIVKPRKANWNTTYVIRLYSSIMFDFCYEAIGQTRRKTDEGILPKVPSLYLPHFVRGYFDGDGSIYYVHYKNRHGNIATELRSSFTDRDNSDQLPRLAAILHDAVGMNLKNAGGGKRHNKLMFGQYDTALLCEWMYEGSTIFMNRKKAIWDSADKDRLKDSSKYRRKVVN